MGGVGYLGRRVRRQLARAYQGGGLRAAAGDDGSGRADDEQRLVAECGREGVVVQVDDSGGGVDPAGDAAGAAGPGGGMAAVADLA